jgi:hypothetical protein
LSASPVAVGEGSMAVAIVHRYLKEASALLLVFAAVELLLEVEVRRLSDLSINQPLEGGLV